MNAMWISRGEPAEPVDLALGDLLPLLHEVAADRWGLNGSRFFWRLDPAAPRPLVYTPPGLIVVRGDPVPLPRLAHAGALALLCYHPATEAGIYDLLCHGLAQDVARRLTGQMVESAAPEAVALACALLRQDGDLALRIHELGKAPPPVTAVAPLVFDEALPRWLRRRLGAAARVAADDEAAQSARREAALWRWLASRRFAAFWPDLLRAVRGSLPGLVSGSG